MLGQIRPKLLRCQDGQSRPTALSVPAGRRLLPSRLVVVLLQLSSVEAVILQVNRKLLVVIDGRVTVRRGPEIHLTIVNNIYIVSGPNPTELQRPPSVLNGTKPACPDAWTFFSATRKCYKVVAAVQSEASRLWRLGRRQKYGTEPAADGNIKKTLLAPDMAHLEEKGALSSRVPNSFKS